jgi:hypothetical protein
MRVRELLIIPKFQNNLLLMDKLRELKRELLMLICSNQKLKKLKKEYKLI